jgi:hypothetical protein
MSIDRPGCRASRSSGRANVTYQVLRVRLAAARVTRALTPEERRRYLHANDE